MKIKVEFEIKEMDKMHHAMLEGAKELEVNAPDSLFVKRNIDLTSIKINQNIGDLEIDVDSNFTIWCINKLLGLIKFIKPVAMFFEKTIDEMSTWIIPVKTNIPYDDEIKTEFDV